MSRDQTAESREVIEDMYGAIQRGDWESVLTFWDPDITWYETDPLPYSGTYRGLEEATPLLNTIAGLFDGESLKVDFVLAEGENVVAFCRVNFVDSGEEMMLSEHWKVRNGKATECRPFYWDPVKVDEAAAKRAADRGVLSAKL